MSIRLAWNLPASPAILEGFLADGRNAIREADRSQIIAEPEGPLADGFPHGQ